jgi:hypothetical protein
LNGGWLYSSYAVYRPNMAIYSSSILVSNYLQNDRTFFVFTQCLNLLYQSDRAVHPAGSLSTNSNFNPIKKAWLHHRITISLWLSSCRIATC